MIHRRRRVMKLGNIARATALAVGLLAGAHAIQPLSAKASPANTLMEMWSHFRFCLRSAHIDKGVDLTLRFSFKRDGTLNGRPMISYFNRTDDEEMERRNAEAIALAIDHCLPVQISESLGAAIAGRPMWIRFHGPRREKET